MRQTPPTMTFARRLNHVENIPQQDSAERAFNKLAQAIPKRRRANRSRYRSNAAAQQTTRWANKRPSCFIEFNKFGQRR
jgi:hypothetical protein